MGVGIIRIINLKVFRYLGNESKYRIGYFYAESYIINTRESCITFTILICGWCQAILSKSICQIRAFPLCFPNVPHPLSGNVLSRGKRAALQTIRLAYVFYVYLSFRRYVNHVYLLGCIVTWLFYTPPCSRPRVVQCVIVGILGNY